MQLVLYAQAVPKSRSPLNMFFSAKILQQLIVDRGVLPNYKQLLRIYKHQQKFSKPFYKDSETPKYLLITDLEPLLSDLYMVLTS
jgi:hypothetical protein